MDNNCGTCKSKILRHSFHIYCSICYAGYHIKCLSNVSCEDSIYTERDTNVWICINCSATCFPFNHIDNDDDFIDALSELWFLNKNFSIHSLKQKIFNPFEFNEGKSGLPIDDVDPDLQFFNDCAMNNASCNSDYYFIDDFVLKKKTLPINDNCFSLIHMNIRSAPSHLQEFESLLDSLNSDFSIIALSETWFSDATIDTYGILGYNHVYNYRSEKRGGGVSLYIKDDLEYTRRNDLSIFNTSLESCFVELPSNQFGIKENVVIGVLYRPHNTVVVTFNDILNDILMKLKNERSKKVYLAGDFNINLLTAENHIPSSEFLELMFSHSFFPLINRPTRVTGSSATLIDNIFCNSINSNFYNAIIYSDISDHFPVCCFDYRIEKN